MSSTSNVQDLLVNVFRPTYKYEAGTGFVPSLTISNVSEVIATRVQAATLNVSDSNGNTYIGCNAGNSASNTASNVAIGYQTMAGALNSSNNVALGFFSLDGLSNSDSNVAIGARTDINGRGLKNVVIGPNVTMGDGSYNILIGSDISAGNGNYRFQLGSLLYGDLSSNRVGILTSAPAVSVDISGLTVFRNKVGIQNPNPQYSLDVNGAINVTDRLYVGPGTAISPIYSFRDLSSGIYQAADASYGTGAVGVSVNSMARVVVTSNKTYIYGNLDVCGTLSAAAGGGGGGGSGTIASNGSATAPSFTFSNDLSTGLHLVSGGSALGFDTSGVLRMCLSGGFLGIGTAAPRVTLDVSGDISANVYNGPGGTQSAPHYTFSDDRTTGIFFPGANMVGFTAGGTERMRISNGNVGIGTTSPTNALDVAGTLRVIGGAGDITLTNGAISIGGTSVISSTGVLSNASATSNQIGGVALTNLDICMSATGIVRAPIVRNALVATQFDISGGNISNSGTTTSTNALVSGYLRNALVPTQFDISGGNIRYTGGITGSTDAATNLIGGVTLTNGQITMTSGNLTARGATLTATNPGQTALAVTATAFGTQTALTVAGYSDQIQITNATAGNQTSVSFGTSGGSISVGNNVGGVGNGVFAISNTNVVLSANSAAVAIPTLRNALTPSTYDISGGTISNSGAHLSSNFRGSNGSVAIPTYSFTSDPSTGLHLGGTSSLAFDTSGVQRMCISGGNVGIGIAGPAFPLDISGTARATQWMSPNPSTVTPTQLSGCLIWFDAADTATITKSGTQVTSWASKGTASVNAITSNGICTTGNVGPNGLNYISCPTTGDLKFTYTQGNQARTWFLVVRNTTQINQSTSPQYWGPLNQITGGASDSIVVTNNGGGVYPIGEGPSGIGLYLAADVGNPFNVIALYTLVNSATSTSSNVITKNGNSLTLTTSVLATAYGVTSKDYSINTAGYATGTDVFEIIYYNRDLTPVERQTIEGYLTWKWNLQGSLPSTHLNAKLSPYMVDISGASINNPGTTRSGIVQALNGGVSAPSYSFITDASSGLYLRDTSILEFATAGAARMCISGGSVGIGTRAPAYMLDICGTVRALDGLKQGTNTWGAYSDQRIKRNIQLADTSTCYSIVKNLPLQRFTWDASYLPNLMDKNVVGWVAQDVEKVFKRAVTTTPDLGFDDLRVLDVDQLYKTMYGALERVIADKEALEVQMRDVLARLARLEASQQSSELTQTTPPTPPPPSEPVPEPQPEPPQPPSSEYVQVPEVTEA